MELYHLGNPKYARQLTGEGARLFSGRWNQKGDSCIYTSATRSLCILEYMANVHVEEMPQELSFTACSIPDKLCQTISLEQLPRNWQKVPPDSTTKRFGSELLADKSSTCFIVPSVLVPSEFNYILNPNAIDFEQIKIISVSAFHLDYRIKE